MGDDPAGPDRKIADRVRILEFQVDQLRRELERLEKIALDVKSDEMLLTDLSLTMLMKGQSLELMDENDQKYEPVFKISYKKAQ